ncbi:3'-5' exonuclease [Cedecea sp.]|jgi:DNA polymerase III epsilon subunit-like protein|uniref:3'-5' exonuclease n=1 Tax=Cedecea sp. TaxID=1970739 RepID=UPI002F410ABE
MTPQQQVQQWLDNDCLILDTETTGLGEDAEIVEITIIDTTGKPLINTLVKPSISIPAEATAIHGITNDMVEQAPTWPEVQKLVDQVTDDKTVVTYNAWYDKRLLKQTDAVWNVKTDSSIKVGPTFECAMLVYAKFYGQKSERVGYKWQKLTAAAEQQGVIIEGTPHRALSDCLTTLGVLVSMVTGGRKFAPQDLSAQKAVDTLQQLFKADADAITALVDHRVECSELFAGKTTATVGQRPNGAYIVGLIGIINALIFPDVIAAVYEGKELAGFTVADISSKAGDA